MRVGIRRAAGLLGIVGLGACRPAAAPLVDRPVLWEDEDRRPFRPKPDDDAPTRLWDGVDHIFVRRTGELFSLPRAGEAVNVNALDEVATSSWFTNRIGRLPMTPDDVAAGPCVDPALDPQMPLQVTSSKLDGVTPGFAVKAKDGKKYMFKLDDVDQSPRPTAADAIASRLYYAIGYTAPCNRVVFFDRARLTVGPTAKITTWTGDKRAMTADDVDLVLTRASRLPDGRYRALASQWLPGDGIGPWRYEKTRPGDPNDVIPHEDRREVRAVRLLAAWLDNTDSRAQNTLDTWIAAGDGRGWVRHAFLDFSDCFGAAWEPTDRWRRMSHAYWLDPGVVVTDFFTLGLRPRTWEDRRFGPSGRVFGYYDVSDFDPEAWKMETPNPAFERMSERDGAWMARILAHFTDEHLERAIRTGRLGSDLLDRELFRVVKGRRDRILQRYFARLSPLSEPVVRGRALCLRDLAVASGLTPPRTYTATIGRQPLAVVTHGPEACVDLPASDGVSSALEVAVANEPHAPGALRVHLRWTPAGPVVAGLERLD